MKKSDLRSGDLVKFKKDNDIYLVLLNARVFNKDKDILLNLRTNNYYELDNFGENLIEDYNPIITYFGYANSIDEVCAEKYVGYNFKFNKLFNNTKNFNNTWQRNGKKEMTIAEIEEKLGYPIKIVKEKNE